MLVTNGSLLLRYNPTDPRLGRHLEVDSRSLPYAVTEEAAKPSNKDYPAPIPILDQGNLGSCTGNAGTRFISWLHQDNLANVKLENFTLTNDAGTDEQFAVELYHDATVNDGFSGTYPPDDTGSSGLGVMRSLKKAALVKSYVHALSLSSLVALLQRGPTIIGSPWYEAFFSPDSNGFIDADPNWLASGIAGGHEFYNRGVELLSGWDYSSNANKIIFHQDNSWNTSWGNQGSFSFTGATYLKLKQQLDVMQGRM